MTFGLFNTLASFWKYIHKILAEPGNVFVIVYLDDILIYTNKADLVDAIWWVFYQLKKYLLYANENKSRLHQDEMRFFGYVVSLQIVFIEDKGIETICNWPELRSV